MVWFHRTKNLPTEFGSFNSHSHGVPFNCWRHHREDFANEMAVVVSSVSPTSHGSATPHLVLCFGKLGVQGHVPAVCTVPSERSKSKRDLEHIQNT